MKNFAVGSIVKVSAPAMIFGGTPTVWEGVVREVIRAGNFLMLEVEPFAVGSKCVGVLPEWVV